MLAVLFFLSLGQTSRSLHCLQPAPDPHAGILYLGTGSSVSLYAPCVLRFIPEVVVSPLHKKLLVQAWPLGGLGPW